jgi:hypothetical protein
MNMKDTPTNKFGRRRFLLDSLATAATLGLPTPAPSQQTARNSSDVPVRKSRALSCRKDNNPPEMLGKRESLLMPFAVFREMQLGSVRPEGWLLEEMTKQANGIAIHQPDFCFPFDRRYWASNERGQDQESRNGGIFWYPWEQVGYWVDGAYRCAKLTETPICTGARWNRSNTP